MTTEKPAKPGDEGFEYPQIKELNAQRPKPEKRLDHTPTGSRWVDVVSKETQEKNAEIDAKIAALRIRIAALKGHAKAAFSLGRERGRAKDAFDRSR